MLILYQISDFGLAKWLPDQWTHHTVSKVEGTFGFVYLTSSQVFHLYILFIPHLSINSLFFFFFFFFCVDLGCHNSYLPPEFFMHGIVDEKTDVYAYGVLLLELITGRQALDSSQRSLVMWVCLVKHLLDMENVLF